MTARPVIGFLHSFGGSSRSWDLICARVGQTYACRTPTLRGFNGEADVDDDWTVSRAADDAWGRLGFIQETPFVLVGHSMGGKLAMAIALRRPLGMIALVLLSPSPPWAEPIGSEQRAETLRSRGSRSAAERMADDTAVHWPPGRRETFVEDMLGTGPCAWAWWYSRGSRELLDFDAARLPPVIHIVIGGADHTIPNEEHRRLTEMTPRAELTVVPDVAHQLPAEAFAKCAELIMSAAQLKL